MRPGSDNTPRSSTRPLYFNDFDKLFVALGDGDASVSLAPFRKTGSPVPPVLRALPVSFELATAHIVRGQWTPKNCAQKLCITGGLPTW